MKLPFLLLPLALLALTAQPARAQEAPTNTIKVTTSINKDGTKTVVQTDPMEGKAETSIYSAQDKLVQKTILKLGDSGTPEGGWVYTVRGVTAKGAPKLVLVYMMVYKRDNLNRLSEVLNYSPTNQLLSRQVYRYDGGSKLIRVDNFDATGKPIGATASQAIPDKKK